MVDRTRAAQIPHDVQYVDIDHMDRFKDFTIDEDNFGGLAAYADELHDRGMKLTLIFDPAIDATDAVRENLLTTTILSTYTLLLNLTGFHPRPRCERVRRISSTRVRCRNRFVQPFITTDGLELWKLLSP